MAGRLDFFKKSLVILCLSFCHTSAFGWEYPLYPSLEGSCPGGIVQNSRQVDPKFLPPTMDQGSTSTCYLHSAYYLLTHFLKLHYGPEVQPSILDFYGRSCSMALDRGGASKLALIKTILNSDPSIHLRDLTDSNESLYLLKTLANVIKEPSKSPLDSSSDQIKSKLLRLENILSAQKSSLALTSEDIEILSNVGPEDLHRQLALNLVTKMKTLKIQIPLFNVLEFDWETDRQDTREPGESGRSRGSKDKEFEVLNSYLSSSNPSPVIMNISLDSRKDSDASDLEDAHSITLTGLRKYCCKGLCSNEYLVKNSYGSGMMEGWMDAHAIKEAAFSAVFILPCQINDCKTYPINRRDPLMSAIRSLDQEIIKNVLEDPKILQDLRSNGLGNQYVFYSDAFGLGNVSNLLRKNGAGDDYAKKRSWGVIHSAAAQGDYATIKKIVKRHSRALILKDNRGHSVADIAMRNLHFRAAYLLMGLGAPLKSSIGLALNYSLKTAFYTDRTVESLPQLLKNKNKLRSESNLFFLNLARSGYDLEEAGTVSGDDGDHTAPLLVLAKDPKLTNLLMKTQSGAELLNLLIDQSVTAPKYSFKGQDRSRAAAVTSKSLDLSTEVLLTSLKNKNRKIVDLLFAHASALDLNANHPEFDPMLHSLMEVDYPTEQLAHLVLLGADVNIKDLEGLTPAAKLIRYEPRYVALGMQDAFNAKLSFLISSGADVVLAMNGKSVGLFEVLALLGLGEDKYHWSAQMKHGSVSK